jgi:LmbE family N-acetylglucosaminyl deacetylase
MKSFSRRACFYPICKSASLLAILLAATLTAPAQSHAPAPLDDPANLAGERVSPQDPADTLPINHGSPALQQLLQKLRTRASFMLIVAHPDDEDGGLLTYLSRGQGARVAMLTLTRGEGGQNLMSADFDDALGLIRTQELLAADRYMGVDQFFGTEVDFGFSKTKEESFAKWTHERVLYDAVRAVRLYRPLVIASVFIGAPSDGHGHHQVSGQIAQEVFNAAGDPTVFPDQIAAGLQPWQPLKVYARVPFARIDDHGMFDYATNQYVPARFTNYVTGKVTTTIPKPNVVVPEGSPANYTAADGTQTPIPGMDGLSYIQFARKGLALEKSQIGPNVRLAPAGRADVSYHRYGSHLTPAQPDGDDSGIESSIFEGIDTSLAGIADLAPAAPAKLRAVLELIDMKLAETQKLFDPAKPEAIAEPLRIALQTLDTVISGAETSALPADQKYNLLHELRIKRVQLNNALIIALGITLDATSPKPDIANGTADDIHATLAISSHEPVDDAHLVLLNAERRIPSDDEYPPPDPAATLTASKPLERSFRTGITGTGFITRPYFIRTDSESPNYILRSEALRNAPIAPPALIVWGKLMYHDAPLIIERVVSSNGQPVSYVPSMSVTVTPQLSVLPNNTDAVMVFVNASPTGQPIRSEILKTRDGWTSVPVTAPSTASGPITFRVQAPTDARHPTTASAIVRIPDGPIFSEGYRPVGYPGLPYTNYYTPATTRIVPVDVMTAPDLNIAYLPGTGDNVPASLEDLGVYAHIITTADLTAEKLKPYDAVVLGVRVYEAHPELAAANAALNAYAAAGGVVIAQYNTGRLPTATGPYPLDLGPSEKVVEETAPVRILTPTDPLLNWPNRITSADFDHWVEERGHGFMSTWDTHYTPLLETHDAGQQPQLGGLLYARTGRGAWIYLGLALYRQLPEGVPGSYRLFANLLSAAKNPALQSVAKPAP